MPLSTIILLWSTSKCISKMKQDSSEQRRSVVNLSDNEHTKSNLKIYQIYIYNENMQFNAIF